MMSITKNHESHYVTVLDNLLINVHIFDYPDPRLSGLFRVAPMSPDNRGPTVCSLASS